MEPNSPILLVEDDANDVFLMQRAFGAAELRNPLSIVNDGEQAISYLKGEHQYADRQMFPYPNLVVVDLKMPRVSGFEVIAWMKQHYPSKLIPIIILSSSALSKDVNRAYELGANAYMVKPADFRALLRLFQTIGEFWNVGDPPVQVAV